jgi:hypothetical protein
MQLPACRAGKETLMNKSLITAPTDHAAGPLSRRTLFAGAGTAGVLAAAAALLPKAPPPVLAAASAAPAPADGGYQLTEHVQRYYQTARV